MTEGSEGKSEPFRGGAKRERRASHLAKSNPKDVETMCRCPSATPKLLAASPRGLCRLPPGFLVVLGLTYGGAGPGYRGFCWAPWELAWLESARLCFFSETAFILEILSMSFWAFLSSCRGGSFS